MYAISRSAFVGKPIDVVMHCVTTVSAIYRISLVTGLMMSTDRSRRVSTIPALHVGGPGFRSLLGNHLS